VSRVARGARPPRRVPAVHKRVVFRNRALPYVLVAPQLAITLVFFIWPAGQALFQSLLLQDAFGLSTRFVWLENFERLFADAYYLQAFRVTPPTYQFDGNSLEANF